MRFLSAETDPFRPSRLVAGVFSDRGRERKNNEDRAILVEGGRPRFWAPPVSVVLDAPRAFYALVCDGMGGEAGGEVASSLAVETIGGELGSSLPALDPGVPAKVGETLVRACHIASRRIRAEAHAEPALARMGTTATLAAFAGGSLICAQVGDSRAYLWRDDALHQLTRDQTLAELVRANGVLDADVPTNMILQALGSSQRLDVVLTTTPLLPDDVVLLCSDGLHGVVGDDVIAAILAEEQDPLHACERLVARANEEGGPDNITCAVVRMER